MPGLDYPSRPFALSLTEQYWKLRVSTLQDRIAFLENENGELLQEIDRLKVASGEKASPNPYRVCEDCFDQDGRWRQMDCQRFICDDCAEQRRLWD